MYLIVLVLNLIIFEIWFHYEKKGIIEQGEVEMGIALVSIPLCIFIPYIILYYADKYGEKILEKLNEKIF